MSITSAGGAGVSARRAARRTTGREWARAYFFSDSRRTAQSVLGLLWLLDGGLQFQPFMYSPGFPKMIMGMTSGQPTWVQSSMTWGVHVAEPHLVVFNTLFALVQVAIGLGLLCRRTVRPAIALSLVWALWVWWYGEAFGMMFMSMASPLTGAPGAVIVYALVGLAVWPSAQPGGLLGVRGVRLAWAALWVVSAWLWLEAPSSNPNAISQAIDAAPSGMSWLSTVQYWAADAARGHGVPIALLLCAVSLAVGVAVAANWRPRPFLAVAVGLNLAYWVLGQGFGGIFQGQATDPNAGPLFILLAFVVYSLTPYRLQSPRVRRVAEAGA